MLTEKVLLLTVLCYGTFFLVHSKTDLMTECETLTYSFYVDRSCFVVGSTNPVLWSTSTTGCVELSNTKGTGPHLAFVLSEKVRDLIKDKIVLPSGLNRYWIGLSQSQPTTDIYGKWGWRLGDGTYIPIPNKMELTFWTHNGTHQIAPNDDIGNRRRLGTFLGITIFPHPAIEDTGGGSYPYICQHHEPISNGEARFHKYGIDMKGHNETNISGGESTEVDGFECGRKCRDKLVCLSFSYHKTTGHCILHWNDPTTVVQQYKPNAAVGYDIYYGID